MKYGGIGMEYSKLNTDEVKEKIAESFVQLLKNTPYVKLTVKKICEATPISRNGFYYHFEGKEDVVKWIVIQHFLKYALPYFKFRKDYIGARAFFYYIYEKKDFYYAIFKVSNGELLRKSLIEAYRIGMSPNYITEYSRVVTKDKFRIDERTCAAYINSAIVGVILFWIEDGMKIPIKIIARDMDLLLTKSMEDIRDYHLY